MSKLNKLEKFLRSGGDVTPGQITSRFKLANPYSAIDSLRDRGNLIYRNTVKSSSGKTVTVYRIGTPTRDMVRALKLFGAFDR